MPRDVVHRIVPEIQEIRIVLQPGDPHINVQYQEVERAAGSEIKRTPQPLLRLDPELTPIQVASLRALVVVIKARLEDRYT